MTSNLPLSGKAILITGASRGIGLTIAKKLRTQGAHLMLCARSQDELNAAKKSVEEYSVPGAKVFTQTCDVNSPLSVARVVEASLLLSGDIYGLVTAAGSYGAIGEFSKVDFEEWAEGISVNFLGTARTIHMALPHMKAGARIVLFSGGGQAAMPNFSSYVSSKGALWRFTETLAAELAPKGIFVNAIAPGAINTKFLDDLIQAGPAKVGEVFYQKSLKQKEQGGEDPQKAADLVSWLMNSDSAGLYGKTISAIWDQYKEWKNLGELSKQDTYCYRRVVQNK